MGEIFQMQVEQLNKVYCRLLPSVNPVVRSQGGSLPQDKAEISALATSEEGAMPVLYGALRHSGSGEMRNSSAGSSGAGAKT